MGAERLSAGLEKVISQMGDLGKLGKIDLAAAKATIVSTIPPSVEQGQTSPSLPITGVNKIAAPITLPDESKRLESALRRIMPVDKLAQSLIGGKWTYTAPKPTKSADESAQLQKWLEQGSKPFAGLDKIGRSLLGGNWTKEMPETKPPTPKEQSLESWREQMAKMQPTITVSGMGKASGETEEERLKKVESLLGSAVGITPASLIKRREEDAKIGGAFSNVSGMDEHEKSIKREAMEAKRLDQINADVRRKEHDHAKFMKDMTFAMMPLMNPGSVWGTLFGARQMFSAFMTNTGQNMIGKFGFQGVGGAASAMAVVMTGLTTVGLGLKAFGMIVREAGKAVGDGMKLYSKSLMSGLGLGYTTQRSVAAGLLGVPENELLRFGTALAWLQPKIAELSRTMSQNAIPLATLSVEWNIFKLKLEAFAGTLAVKFKPALDKIMDGMTKFLVTVSSSLNVDALVKDVSALSTSLVKLIPTIQKLVEGFNVAIALQSFLSGKTLGMVRIVIDGVKVVFTAIGDLLGVLMAKVNNFLMSNRTTAEKANTGFGLGGGLGLYAALFLSNKKNQESLGMTQMNTADMMKSFAGDMDKLVGKTSKDWDDLLNGDSFKDLTDSIKALFGIATDKNKPTAKDPNLLPPPLTMMKQLPVSAWEKMGLVIAGGHNQALDYSRRTANAVETIAHHIANMGNGSTIPRANQFNLDRFVTNP